MIFIKVDEQNNITYRHNFPFDPEIGLGKTEEELLIEGKLVPMPAEPGIVAGKIPVEKYDANNNSIAYEWVDIPKTPEQLQAESIKELQAQNAQMILALVLGGLM